MGVTTELLFWLLLYAYAMSIDPHPLYDSLAAVGIVVCGFGFLLSVRLLWRLLRDDWRVLPLRYWVWRIWGDRDGPG